MPLSLYLPGLITRDILHPFRISLKDTSCPKDDLVNSKPLHLLMAAPEVTIPYAEGDKWGAQSSEER